jgi:hypothetical protein
MSAIGPTTAPIVLSRAGAPWRIDRAAEKLMLRARMPGAFVYDRVAHSIRVAEASGVPIEDRLVIAFPACWLVNARVPSPILRRWSLPPLCDAWLSLVDALKGGPERWLACTSERDVVTRCLATLAVEGIDDAPEAISKVLALLVPECVPLMPAESRAFALGADAARADGAFLAMLDWFARSVLEAEPALIALARDYATCPLDAAQVLDRLLYFDSIGHQHFKQT